MITKETRILIVGLGLLGGSYARALTRAGCHVEAIDQNPDSIGFALHEGIISKGASEPDAELCADADLVIFGLYPTTMIKWVREHQHKLKSGALLTDVSGVKGGVLDVVQELLRPDLEFVGCHPMAGREVSGVRNSTDSMFAPANFLVVPTERNSQQGIDLAKELGALLGFHTVSTLSLKEHDEMIGFVSQLTHAIAVSLMTCNEDENLQNYTGDSFRDLTRIARINEELWSELFLLNKDALGAQIDAFQAELGRLRTMLEQGDSDGL
ncbi:MAG: prephenate dehydrogenase, partial [Pygmaiobacter sp.]